MKKQNQFLLLSIAIPSVFFSFKMFAVEKTPPEKCVFKTVFGENALDENLNFVDIASLEKAVNSGLEWILTAQHQNGGWGCGLHRNQKNMNPMSVTPDPATTAMVGMALLRSGMEFNDESKNEPLLKATEFILDKIENAKPDGSKITELQGTQIQRKLGDNIDLVMSLQFLNNLLEELDEQDKIYDRVFVAVNRGTDILQTTMDEEGKVKGAGWAGVLQSAFATSALESSASNGAYVDNSKLNKAKGYLRNNYNPATEEVKTRDGAGIILYSVSGSVRANAKEARKAKNIIDNAKEKGILKEDDLVIYENFKRAGISEDEALLLDSAYKVYETAKKTSQKKEVMSGFGNNGGEEFISFLQTGESLIINEDDSWKSWYDSMSANLLNIQNQDGSWNGHHCITSPVFCTASCLLILTITNDIETLIERGVSKM